MPHKATLALAALLTLVAPLSLRAEPQAQRTLTMQGQGEVKAAPDSAQLAAGVTAQGRTAAEALAANTRAMNGVFATLKQSGIPEKAIQTSDFSVAPRYAAQRPGGEENHIVGYQVSNTVNVTLDDLAKLGPILDALVTAGANQVNGVSFTIRDPKLLLTRAREEAVKDALARAQTYAAAAGVTLGPILSIGEGGSDMPRPMFRMAMAMAPAAPPPIAGGEQSVTANVSITWEIR